MGVGKAGKRHLPMPTCFGQSSYGILILTDFNDDIHDAVIVQFFEDLGLQAVHLAVHGQSAPPTHQRGQTMTDRQYIRIPQSSPKR